jgi:hypothetical protein
MEGSHIYGKANCSDTVLVQNVYISGTGRQLYFIL